jgi:hypothetical protein
LVVERVYLGLADVGDAKNPESESAPRCTRRDTREHSYTRMVWGRESIRNQPGNVCMIMRGRSYTEIAHSSHKTLAEIDDK